MLERIAQGETDTAGQGSVPESRNLRAYLSTVARPRKHVSQTSALLGRMAGSGLQRNYLWRAICAAFSQIGRQGRCLGRGPSHRADSLVWLLLHEEIENQERGLVPLSRNRLMRKLRRLQEDFLRAGLDISASLNVQNQWLPAAR